MRNWLVWAETMWSSDDPRERFMKGLPVKLFVEGGIALVIVFGGAETLSLLGQWEVLPPADFPTSIQIVELIVLPLVFGIIFCNLIRER